MPQYDLLNTDLSLRQLDLLFQQTTFGTRVDQIVEQLKLTQDQRKLLKQNIYLTSLKATGQQYQNKILKAEAEFREKTNGLRIQSTNAGFQLQTLMSNSSMAKESEFMKFLGFEHNADGSFTYMDKVFNLDTPNLIKYLNNKIGEGNKDFGDVIGDLTKVISLLSLIK